MRYPIALAWLALAASTGLGTIVAGAQTAPPADSGDPIDLFAKMMPVFSHPRCANCHGGVNPSSRASVIDSPVPHGGPVVDNTSECADCHTTPQAAADRWVLAGNQGLRFYGKSTKQLCDMQSQKVRDRGRAGYYSHLATDPLIAQGFDGLAAGARTTADPPSMKKGAFLAAAREWLDAGAGCGSWEGEIRQEERFQHGYSYDMPGGPINVQVTESANRSVTIRRADGANTGTFTGGGHQTIVQTIHAVTDRGPCTTVITSNTDWVFRPPAGDDISVRVHLKGDGTYTIHFSGPEETTVTNEGSHVADGCGSVLPPRTQDPPIVLVWPKWRYTIRCKAAVGGCHLFDPANKSIRGSTQEVVPGASNEEGRRSWIEVSLVGTSRADDGAPLATTVTTTWILLQRE